MRGNPIASALAIVLCLAWPTAATAGTIAFPLDNSGTIAFLSPFPNIEIKGMSTQPMISAIGTGDFLFDLVVHAAVPNGTGSLLSGLAPSTSAMPHLRGNARCDGGFVATGHRSDHAGEDHDPDRALQRHVGHRDVRQCDRERASDPDVETGFGRQPDVDLHVHGKRQRDRAGRRTRAVDGAAPRLGSGSPRHLAESQAKPATVRAIQPVAAGIDGGTQPLTIVAGVGVVDICRGTISSPSPAATS